MRLFIDTNIWIYAFLEVPDKKSSDSIKRKIILKAIKNRLINDDIFTSIQAINEFHWILKRKYKISENIIKKKVNSIIEISQINALDIEVYFKSFELREKYSLSFWDSLMLSSALLSDCNLFYSEDMQNDMVIDKKLKIINPFIT
jgi:predicted nucleic acid-binding protein